MRISHQLVPPGGWKFRQDTTWIKGQTWDQLRKNVEAHRESNGIAIGNLDSEIEEFLAEENPSIIIDGAKLKKKPMGVSYYHTVQSFVQFLWNWTLKGGELVDQNTANLRAQICAGCHNNKPSGDIRGGCSACNKAGNMAINAVRATIIKTKATTSDGDLKACAMCGCDLKVSVWIPNQILLKLEDSNAYPAFCWKKKIEQNLEV